MVAKASAGFGQKFVPTASPLVSEATVSTAWHIPEELAGRTRTEKAFGIVSKFALVPLGINWAGATIALAGYELVDKATSYIADTSSTLANNATGVIGYWAASTVLLAGAAVGTIGNEYHRRRERQTRIQNNGAHEHVAAMNANDRVSILDTEMVPRDMLLQGSKTRKVAEYLSLSAMYGLLMWAAPDAFASLYHYGQMSMSGGDTTAYSQALAWHSERLITKVGYAICAGLGSVAVAHLPNPRRAGTDFIATHFPKAFSNYEMNKGR